MSDGEFITNNARFPGSRDFFREHRPEFPVHLGGQGRLLHFATGEESKSSPPGYNGMQHRSVAFNHDRAAPASPRLSARRAQVGPLAAERANPETTGLPDLALSRQGALPIIPFHDG